MQKRIQVLFSITAVVTMGFAGYIALSSNVPLNTNLGAASSSSHNVTLSMQPASGLVEGVQAQDGSNNDDQNGECGEDEVEVSVEVGGNRCVQNSENSLEDNAIVVYLRYLIQFLTAGVGLVITIMIVVGGFQYITAGENSQKVQAAKQKIFNAVLALILFILMYALLNYLVPVDIL